jgi:hypothetical protein
MDKAEWRACAQPIKMLEFLRKRRVNARSYRLASAACCRRAWPALPDERCRAAVAVLERFADGPGKKNDQAELKAAFAAAKQVVADTVPGSQAFYLARTVAAAVEPTLAWWTTRWSVDWWLGAVEKGAPTVWGGGGKTAKKKETLAMASLLRCLLMPFPQITAVEPSVLAWNGGAVVKMARAIYEERAFDQVPILADALEDAGLTDTDILGHLRGPGPHARGCHALDALLGKALPVARSR